MLIVPGADGEIGVLARHAPLIAMLNAGSTRVHVKRESEVLEFATGPGFFKVELDRAIALVDDAVDAREIDDSRAQRQLETARAELERLEAGGSAAPRAQRQLETARAELERLEAGDSTADRWQLEQRVAHAENQLRVAGRGG